MSIRKLWYKMENLFWKVRYWVEKKFTDWRLRKVYKYKPFYDKFSKRYRLYFEDPKIYDEEGSIEYVVSEYVQDGLIYEFKLNGKYSHEHTFSAVLDTILRENGVGFEIPEDVKYQYSDQEINFINKYLEKLNS